MSQLIPTLNTPRRIHIAAYLFFLAVAVLITWPLVTVLSTHFAGYDFGDAHEMTRHIWWFKYAAQHGAPLLFQPLLGYPDGMEGVILWSDPLQFFPGWLFAFLMPLPAAYNLQSLLNLALNGWAAYFLVWKLTGQRLPALLAGVVFLAAPTIQGHLAGGHGGLLVQWPLPILAYALFSLRASTRLSLSTESMASSSLSSQQSARSTSLDSSLGTRNSEPGTSSRLPLIPHASYLITVFFILLPFGHTLQLIYAGLPLIAVFGLTLLVERNWRGLVSLILSVGIGTILFVIFLIPVLSATFGTSAYTGEGGGVAYSLDLLALATPSFNHPLYGQLDYTHRVLGINIVEGSSYIGVVAGILAVLAIWKNRTARWWLLLAGVAWVLALGPLLKIFDQPVSLHNAEYSSFVTLPWVLVADLPGFSLARTPGRFNFLIALAVSVLAAYGLSILLSSRPFTRATASEPSLSTPLSSQSSVLSPFFAFILIVLILLDYQSFWPLPTYSAEVPQAVYDLAQREDVRAVFDMPWDNLLAAKDALWLQTAHEKPIIAGQVTRRTPVSPAKLTILEQTLDPVLLNEVGADVIILHKTYDYDGTLGTVARERLGTPFYQDERIAIWDAPEASSAAVFTTILPPEGQIAGVSDSYFYVPEGESGWLRFQVHLTGEAVVSFKLNGEVMDEPIISGDTRIILDFPITTPGYHTITLDFHSLCPALYPPELTCRYFTSEDYGADFMPSMENQVNFGRGVRLGGARFDRLDSLRQLSLWWQFDQPMTDQDIRFVKVLDEGGNQAAGFDSTLGAVPAGAQRLETLDLNLPSELAAGTYRVYVGWYSYPDLVRFPVLSDVPGAQDGWAMIGEFTIPAE